MTNNKISILHVILISMTFIGLKNHVTIIPPLLKVVGRDGWASVIMSAFFMLLWGPLFLYIHVKTKGQQLNKWIEGKLGKTFTSIFLLIFGTSLIILASFTMREMLLWVNSTFLPHTPVISLLILFTILCMFVASSTIQSIAIANIFVLLWVVVFGFFVAFTNLQVKDFQLLLPFFEDGMKATFKGTVYPAAGIIELLLFLFIQQKVQGQLKFRHYLVMLIILTGLTLGPLIGSIIEFGPHEAALQRYPAYEEWRIIGIGSFIEHLDFLSIYQWFTGALIRIGFILYVAIHVLRLTGKKASIWGLVTPLFMASTAFLIYAIEDTTFIKMKEMYVLPITFVVLLLISLFLAVLTVIPNTTKQS